MPLKNPFKQLDNYEYQDIEIFFGREQEVNQLYNTIQNNNSVVLFGYSGVGKSSIIECGLRNKFYSHEWQPIIIRRINDLNLSLFNELKSVLNSKEEKKDNYFIEKEDFIRKIFLENYKPIYLIFDQFEELLILNNNYDKPNTVSNDGIYFKDEIEVFKANIHSLLRSEYPVKMIFVIREEYIGRLNILRKVFPKVFFNELRIESTDKEKLTEILKGFDNDNHDVKIEEYQQFTELLFNKLKVENSDFVELTNIQLFLYDLFEKKQKINEENNLPAQKIIFDVRDLDAIEDDFKSTIEKFFEEQLEVIRDELVKLYPDTFDKNLKEKIKKFLLQFVSIEGTKEPKLLYNISCKIGSNVKINVNEFKTQLLEILTDKRFLRVDDRNNIYEISHDKLAKVIFDKNDERDKYIYNIRKSLNDSNENDNPISEERYDYLVAKGSWDALIAEIEEEKESENDESKKEVLGTHLKKLRETQQRILAEREKKKANEQEIINQNIALKKTRNRLWVAFVGMIVFVIILIWGILKIQEAKKDLKETSMKNNVLLQNSIAEKVDEYLNSIERLSKEKDKDLIEEIKNAALMEARNAPDSTSLIIKIKEK